MIGVMCLSSLLNCGGFGIDLHEDRFESRTLNKIMIAFGSKRTV